MVDEIVCRDCEQVFYDWWDADHHVCRLHPNRGQDTDEGGYRRSADLLERYIGDFR